MPSAQLVDKACLVLALIVPAFVVFRFGHRQVSVLLGAIFFWGIPFACGILLSELDPTRDAAMLDSIWLLFGWIPAVFYALVLYWLRRGFVFLRTRRSAAAQSKN